jgi:redox-sensing transcriptional repressor
VVGQTVAGQVVQHANDLEGVVSGQEVQIGVVAVPAAQAQEVCNRLVAAGVASVLNFAPCVLGVPDGVTVRRVDLSTELQILAFHQQRQAAAQLASEAGPGGEPPAEVAG